MSGQLYGNVEPPRAARTLGLSMASVVVCIAGAVATFVMVMVLRIPIWVAGGALLLAAAGVVFLETGKRDGRGRLERVIASRGEKRAHRRDTSRYVSGPTSGIPDGTFRAPGLLASTEMFEGADHFGRRFAFLWDPIKRTGTVFFSVSGSGLALQDQETIDFLVSAWGGYLQQSGSLASMSQVAATVTSMKDSGERLPAAVADARARVDREGIPPFATEAVDEIVAITNQGNGRVDARIAVTFSAVADPLNGLEVRTRAELMSEVMVHLPAMTEQLELSSGGVVAYLEPEDIIDATYVAFNPETALAVDRARLSGVGTGLRWEEVGPNYAVAHRNRYEHGGGFSKSFQVWRAPAGVFRENSLEAILSPDGISEQKRVTILYRIMTPEQSQKRVQTAVSDAEYETNQKGRKATQAQRQAGTRTARTEAEVADGAALVRFAFVITVTVLDEAALRRVPSMVRNACQSGVQLSVRGADGNEDAAFAIGLGLGVVPATWATLSMRVREAL